MINILFKALGVIMSKATDFEENWDNITFRLCYYTDIQYELQNLFNAINDYNELSLLRITADGDDVEIEEVDDFMDSKLNVMINKHKLKKQNDYHIQYFYNINYFENWLKKQKPFTKVEFDKIKIIVNEFQFTFSGPNFLVSNNWDMGFDNKDLSDIPDDDMLYEYVTIPSGRNITFNTKKYLITCICGYDHSENSSDASKRCYDICLRNTAATLCVTFVSELDDNLAVLQGIRRVKLPLYNSSVKVKLDTVNLLVEIVEWIYGNQSQTKIKIKSKLLLDRITLDVDSEKSLLDNLPLILRNSFDQAKERYHFVMLERRDDYAKELRNLLKDIKSQSDLYTAKIRSLLNNLLRDVLAGLLFVGFTLFTKFDQINILILKEKLVDVLFKALTVYFFTSAVLQILSGVNDLWLSRRELKYWCNTTRELMPKKELDEHINETLNSRLNWTIFFYIIITAVYLCICYISWNFPCIWKRYLN